MTSPEIVLSALIDRYGVQAIMNRAYLGAGEINRIYAAESIMNLFRLKAHSSNWAEWAGTNKEDATLLTQAMMAAVEEGLIEDAP